jgi:hypothetical protein
VRPIVQGEPVVLGPATPDAAAAPEGAAFAAQRPLDLSPLPPPPGFGGPTDGVPSVLQSKEPSEVVEIKAQHALPILDSAPAPRVATPISSPAQVSAAGGDKPRPAPVRGVRTVLGMPGASPGLRAPSPGGTDIPRPDQSGRTGDTSLGLPVARPRPPGAKAAADKPPEEGGGLRFWPPQIEDKGVRSDAETPAFGVHIIRELAMAGAEPDRQTPATPGIPPLRMTPVTGQAEGPVPAPGPGPGGPSEPDAGGAAAEAVRFRVSLLQRQLARGEITQDEYQARLDELRTPAKY